jgi:hypothetical protein
MGAYLNPPNKEKEKWLETEGIRVPLNMRWTEVPEGTLPVVLAEADYIDHFHGTVAPIACNEGEFNNARVSGSKRRPKELFIVPIAKLAEALSPPEYEELQRTLRSSNPEAARYLPRRSEQKKIGAHVRETGRLKAFGRQVLARIRSPGTRHGP